MKFSKFEEYTLSKSGIQAVKTFLNFSEQNNIDITPHEETENKYKQIRNIDIVKEFPPLLFSVKFDKNKIHSLSSSEDIKHLTLLDGHHRFEHLKLYEYDFLVPIVLISEDDVKIESYNSRINLQLEKFIYVLEENNFEISNSSKYFLTFDGKQYSNQKIDNIYDLYDFKRKLISEDVIAPAQNDIIQNESTILDFTPIKLSEFYKENYLFPPKSTWISPRI